jgi:hypothetical protein
MSSHLALGSDGHKMPAHGNVVHDTQTGEHKQVHHQPVHHQPEHKEEDSDSEDSESDVEVDVEAIKKARQRDKNIEYQKKELARQMALPADEIPRHWATITTVDANKLKKIVPKSAPIYQFIESLLNGGWLWASDNEMEDVRTSYLEPNNEDGKYTSLINKIKKMKGKNKKLGYHLQGNNDIEV